LGRDAIRNDLLVELGAVGDFLTLLLKRMSRRYEEEEEKEDIHGGGIIVGHCFRGRAYNDEGDSQKRRQCQGKLPN
jgi:hypothetical protein